MSRAVPFLPVVLALLIPAPAAAAVEVSPHVQVRQAGGSATLTARCAPGASVRAAGRNGSRWTSAVANADGVAVVTGTRSTAALERVRVTCAGATAGAVVDWVRSGTPGIGSVLSSPAGARRVAAHPRLQVRATGLYAYLVVHCATASGDAAPGVIAVATEPDGSTWDARGTDANGDAVLAVRSTDTGFERLAVGCDGASETAVAGVERVASGAAAAGTVIEDPAFAPGAAPAEQQRVAGERAYVAVRCPLPGVTARLAGRRVHDERDTDANGDAILEVPGIEAGRETLHATCADGAAAATAVVDWEAPPPPPPPPPPAPKPVAPVPAPPAPPQPAPAPIPAPAPSPVTDSLPAAGRAAPALDAVPGPVDDAGRQPTPALAVEAASAVADRGRPRTGFFSIAAHGRQLMRRAVVRVEVTCQAPCRQVSAVGFVRAGGRRFPLPRRSSDGDLVLRISRTAVRLAARRTARATVVVRAFDAAGNKRGSRTVHVLLGR